MGLRSLQHETCYWIKFAVRVLAPRRWGVHNSEQRSWCGLISQAAGRRNSENRTFYGSWGNGNFKSLTIELEGQLRRKRIRLIIQSGSKITHVVNVIHESLYIITSDVVSGEFGKLATSPSCLGATIREAGVRLLGICERITQILAYEVRSGLHRRRPSKVTSYVLQSVTFTTPSKITLPTRCIRSEECLVFD